MLPSSSVISPSPSSLILRTINPQLTNINLEQNLAQNAGEITAESIDIPDELQISGGDAYLRETGQYTGSGPNVSKNITTYDAILKKAADEFGISCTVLKAHAYAESNMNPKAHSKAGAQGLIQLMPKTFASTKVGTDPYDPLTNARAAAYYLKQLSTQACGKKSHPSCTENPYSQYVTAAYNGGPGINFPGTCGKTKWECREKYKGGTNNETIGYVNHVWANIKVLNDNKWGC
jgi:soluble lytic murein transglycosylase-like protein